MNSMVEILAYYAEKQPDKILVADNWDNEFTYEQAWNKVKTIADTLSSVYGIKKSDKIMVECNQDAIYLLIDFACELLGAVFVPIENNASYECKVRILKDTEAVLLITKTRQTDFLCNILFDDLEIGISSDTDDKKYQFPPKDDIAEILYTTGTTGTSKGIVITNQANVAVAENIKYGVDMKQNNVELIPIPISHSHGIRCCYANLLNGSTIVLIDGLMKVKDIFRLMDKYSVTALDISPSATVLLIKISKGKFWEYGKKLDYIQIGTAALSEDLKLQLISELPGVHLYNFYGSTESGRSCVLDFSVDKEKSNSIGKATKNSQIVFTDENRNFIEATKENPGLLASKGKMNMVGYWKNQDLSSNVMQDGYIFSNDLGYKDNDGYIYVLGRKDDVINYNGIKIAPEEIESIAVKYPGIKDAACIPQQDTVAGQVPRLYVSINTTEAFDMKGYTKYLQEHLDGNKVPKKVDIIEEIPRTYNGKIKRKDLIER